jgi:PPOX class probable FMN-dependent enzyme
VTEFLQQYQFADTVDSEDELRAILGSPLQRSLDKAITELDEYCIEHIARSPFVLIASSDAAGNFDVSPKGDPAGFVRVLDSRTLLIPDRPGNRRADTFTNVLQNPNVALLFLVPGRRETLRVIGRARIVRDEALRESMAAQGKVPQLLLGISVSEVFFHCAKCVLRSDLWHGYVADDLATLGEIIVKHAGLSTTPDELQAEIEEANRTHLY